MLSVRGPSNIPGKMVSTSNCIDLQKPLGGVDIDDSRLQIDTRTDGTGERNEKLLPPFSFDPEQIGATSPEDVPDPAETLATLRHDFQAYEAENIIGALGEV